MQSGLKDDLFCKIVPPLFVNIIGQKRGFTSSLEQHILNMLQSFLCKTTLSTQLVPFLFSYGNREDYLGGWMALFAQPLAAHLDKEDNVVRCKFLRGNVVK